MEFTGKIAGINVDWQTGRYAVTFTCNEPAAVKQNYDKLKDIEILDIKAVKHRKKRSLNANRYYWELITKLAEKVHISNNCCHNLMLRKYGQIYQFGEDCSWVYIPDTTDAENAALESETFHVKPTSQVARFEDGSMRRGYILLKGSSEYDTKEMSRLIDGLVSECKEQGIETLSPEELEQMMKAWKT
mgnify:CR=1 FL=1